MMGFAEKKAKEEISHLRFSLTRRVFPVAIPLMLLFHTSLFGLCLPIFYYILSVLISLLAMHSFFRAEFSKVKVLWLALVLPCFHLVWSLWLGREGVSQVLALSWLSSLLIGLWALDFANTSENKRLSAKERQETQAQDNLSKSRESVSHTASLLQDQKKAYDKKKQLLQDEMGEQEALLLMRETETRQLYAIHETLTQGSHDDRESLIQIQGKLNETKSLLTLLKEESKSLQQEAKQLQRKVNYYRVEYFHRGSFMAAAQSTQIPPIAAKKETQAALLPPAFSEMITKLSDQQQLYQTQFNQYTDEIKALEKQLKGKKKESALGSALDEKKAKSDEIKLSLNDINRKIFILKKQQVEKQKAAAYV